MKSQPNLPQMEAPESGVKVRMYRVGSLGDCFLLAFRAESGSARYMLIDCGVFFATSGGSERMKAIARDIQAATGGCIHVLVATHEHWDHLSGFQYAREIFDEIQVEEAWLAWTEHPGNPLAERLRKRREFTLRALDTAFQKLREVDSPLVGLVEGIFGFHDDLAAASGLRGSAGQMKYVQEKARITRYLRPTEPPITWKDLSGFRIFVLGPPENEELLTRSDPSGLEGEVYERPEGLNTQTAFYISVLAGDDPGKLPPSEADIFSRSLPFDGKYRIPIKTASDHAEFGAFFKAAYGFSSDQGKDQGPEWRRIDTEWLRTLADLALRLDNDTNNTSLALAIELPGGKVLLFPGDAQVGNWLSWHQLSWPDEKKGTITTTDLLQRTVLYKVGHHGSHNATLRAKGLELMTSPDLIALIPVYKAAAERRGWAMPFPQLLERLMEKTQGRILYSDPDFLTPQDPVNSTAWDVIGCCVTQDESQEKLWVELVVGYP